MGLCFPICVLTKREICIIIYMYTAILLSLHVQYVKKRKTRLITREIRRIPLKIGVGLPQWYVVIWTRRRRDRKIVVSGTKPVFGARFSETRFSRNTFPANQRNPRVPGTSSISERVDV